MAESYKTYARQAASAGRAAAPERTVDQLDEKLKTHDATEAKAQEARTANNIDKERAANLERKEVETHLERDYEHVRVGVRQTGETPRFPETEAESGVKSTGTHKSKDKSTDKGKPEETVAEARERREAERQAAVKDWMDVVDPSQLGPLTPEDIALADAVRLDDAMAAGLAVDAGADVHREDRIGRTPLLWASYYGHLSVVNKLLECFADPTHRDELWNTAQMLAQKNGHLTVVDRLLRPRELPILKTQVRGPSGAPLVVRNQHKRLVLPAPFELGVQYESCHRSVPRNHAALVEKQMQLYSQADEDLPSSRR